MLLYRCTGRKMNYLELLFTRNHKSSSNSSKKPPTSSPEFSSPGLHIPTPHSIPFLWSPKLPQILPLLPFGITALTSGQLFLSSHCFNEKLAPSEHTIFFWGPCKWNVLFFTHLVPPNLEVEDFLFDPHCPIHTLYLPHPQMPSLKFWQPTLPPHYTSSFYSSYVFRVTLPHLLKVFIARFTVTLIWYHFWWF